MPQLRSRVKELRLIPAREILGAPWNWRLHPQAQLDLIAASVEELGLHDPLDVYEVGNGLVQLFDGHARRDLVEARVGPDTLVPCNVTDLSEREAKRAMLLKDPVAALAQADNVALAALARQCAAENRALEDLVEGMRRQAQPFQPALEPSSAPVAPPTQEAIEEVRQALADKMVQPRDLVTVTCPNCHGQFGIDGP